MADAACASLGSKLSTTNCARGVVSPTRTGGGCRYGWAIESSADEVEVELARNVDRVDDIRRLGHRIELCIERALLTELLFA